MKKTGSLRDERGPGPWARSTEDERDIGNRLLQTSCAYEKHTWKAELSILGSAMGEVISRLLHLR